MGRTQTAPTSLPPITSLPALAAWGCVPCALLCLRSSAAAGGKAVAPLVPPSLAPPPHGPRSAPQRPARCLPPRRPLPPQLAVAAAARPSNGACRCLLHTPSQSPCCRRQHNFAFAAAAIRQRPLPGEARCLVKAHRRFERRLAPRGAHRRAPCAALPLPALPCPTERCGPLHGEQGGAWLCALPGMAGMVRPSGGPVQMLCARPSVGAGSCSACPQQIPIAAMHGAAGSLCLLLGVRWLAPLLRMHAAAGRMHAAGGRSAMPRSIASLPMAASYQPLMLHPCVPVVLQARQVKLGGRAGPPPWHRRLPRGGRAPALPPRAETAWCPRQPAPPRVNSAGSAACGPQGRGEGGSGSHACLNKPSPNSTVRPEQPDPGLPVAARIGHSILAARTAPAKAPAPSFGSAWAPPRPAAPRPALNTSGCSLA